MIIQQKFFPASLFRLLFLSAVLFEVARGSIRVKVSISQDGLNATHSTSSTSVKYMVLDGANQTLFHGGDIAVYINGEWCVARAPAQLYEEASASSDKQLHHVPLVFKRSVIIKGNMEGLGRYRGIRIEWSCHTSTGFVPIATSFKNFASKHAIMFEMDWPKGASNTSLENIDPELKATLASFPSFVFTSLSMQQSKVPSTSLVASVVSAVLPSALSWEGSFIQSVRGFSTGPTGGPTVFFNASDPSLGTVVVASPYNFRRRDFTANLTSTWNTFTAGNGKDWTGNVGAFSPGTTGRITSIPPGFGQSLLLYQGSAGGITATLDEWGITMQASRQRSTVGDVTLEKIGYQTDNGAMYCFCTSSNCSRILIEEKEYLDSIGIPIGYLSFQGAGTSSGRGKAAPWCVETWGVDGGQDPNHYPLDVRSLHDALGVPLQLYAPYFCPNSTYFGEGAGGGKVEDGIGSTWKSVSSNTSLPSCSSFNFETVGSSDSERFFSWFLKRGAAAGMGSFESDFMNQNVNCINDFIQSATATDQWMSGMADAALSLEMPIQWCYATPNEVMASVEFPSVTNFRVSFDFCYGESYNIGESSLLVWAMGKSPSKDTLWTTNNGKTSIPGCPWTDDHEGPAAELHVALALLSTGPMGISDAIGMTNASLLSRAIAMDGTLLQPMKPVTAVDSSFLLDSNLNGYLYGTYGRGSSWIYISFLLGETYGVTLRDFWPRVQIMAARSDIRNRPMLAYRRFSDQITCRDGDDAVKSGCVVFVSPSNDTEVVFAAPRSDFSSRGTNFKPTITTIWQSCEESGWFFLGELEKFVALSPKRFLSVSCTKTGVSASMRGSMGENIDLTFLVPRHDISGDSWYEVVRREMVVENIDGALSFEMQESRLIEMTMNKKLITR
jgi:hypothetical protein